MKEQRRLRLKLTQMITTEWKLEFVCHLRTQEKDLNYSVKEFRGSEK